MTVQSSRDQASALVQAQPRLNVQQEVQKGLQQDEKNVGSASTGSNANKQILAATANIKRIS